MVAADASRAFAIVVLRVRIASPFQFVNVSVDSAVVLTPSLDHMGCRGASMIDANPKIVSDFANMFDTYHVIQ